MKKGKTTRIVDRCVQEFFNNGVTYIYEGRLDKNKTDEVFDLFLNRMQNEHKGSKYIYEYGTFDRIPCWRVEKHDL